MDSNWLKISWGGIVNAYDELNERIDRIVEHENVLRAEIKKIIAELTARKRQYEYYREKLLAANEEFDKLPF